MQGRSPTQATDDVTPPPPPPGEGACQYLGNEIMWQQVDRFDALRWLMMAKAITLLMQMTRNIQVLWRPQEMLHTDLYSGCLQGAVLPGGRNSGQKAQKGPQKKKVKKVGRKNLWPNFGWILPKSGRKGPQKIFKRSSLFLVMITTCNVHQYEIKFDF